MTDVRALVGTYFGARDGELLVGGVPVGEIADRFGTPVYVYAADVIDAKLGRLRQALPADFDVHYSIKANPSQVILRHLLLRGCGLEVASSGELHQALVAGCDPGRILFAGPGKTDSDLRFALETRIGEIHAESLDEIARLASASRQLGVRGRVAVRVNPGREIEGGALRMGGRPSPFGIDEELLDSAVERIEREEVLEFAGLHFYLGSQILDHQVLIRQYEGCLDTVVLLAERTGRPIPTIDFGGGFGIPYFQHEQDLDVELLGRDLGALTAAARGRHGLAGTRFIVEPGRYLVGEAGVYVARVNTVKRSRGKSFVIVDGGMNHHLAASGNLGQVIRRNLPVALINKLGSPEGERADVVGPLCTPLDTLARDLPLPRPEPGDLVGIFQSGAYARSASPLGFLSHPAPPEVWVREGECHLARRRGRPEDAVLDQTDPLRPA
jgi:diaminopimelate decarboxylase